MNFYSSSCTIICHYPHHFLNEKSIKNSKINGKINRKYQNIDKRNAQGRGIYPGKKCGESDLVGASHRRVTRTRRVVVEDRCA